MTSRKQLCSPCLRAKVEREAVVYCTDCQEPICGECKNTHVRIKVLMHHKFCDINEATPLAVHNLLKRLSACSIHDNEEIFFTCTNHGSSFCNKCLLSSHMKCDHVRLLSDVLEHEDLTDCNNALCTFEDSAKKLLEHEDIQEHKLTEIQDDVRAQLYMLKKNILERFAQLESSILEELACKKLEIQSTINNQKHEVEQFLMEVHSNKSMIESVVKYGNRQQVFLMKNHVLKNLIGKLDLSDRCLKGTKSKLALTLKENMAVDPFLTQLASAFTLEVVNDDETENSSDFVISEFNSGHRAHFIKDISLPEYSYAESAITSCVWMGEYVVIGRGSRLLVVDINLHKITTRKFKSRVGSITKMDQSTVVAYLRKTNTIELVEFNEGKITAVREIHPKATYKGVFGIEPLGRLICVSENKGTIDILNKDGTIVQECTLDDHAATTVIFAKYCAFDNKNQIIYMSCCELY
ncbi:hypothetical protein DPMN_171154 [Dreissena polymorpha]|uniref:B box-type domain-containing protein n=1 Tax=Dreissena polymorpha TaxID=45954 RepID=A0A9D4DZ77_DREPO|nr:hypothetical protein DPMN_171154 [Dreissena polymorpha]